MANNFEPNWGERRKCLQVGPGQGVDYHGMLLMLGSSELQLICKDYQEVLLESSSLCLKKAVSACPVFLHDEGRYRSDKSLLCKGFESCLGAKLIVRAQLLNDY